MRLSLLSALAVILGSVATADDEPLKGDLARFQGKWSGQAGPRKDIAVRYTFQGTNFEVRFRFPSGGEGEMTGEIKLDEAAKPHKALDWTQQLGGKGQAFPDQLAIYTFEGPDTLKICTASTLKDPRPTEFFESVGGGTGTIVLKRLPAEEKPK